MWTPLIHSIQYSNIPQSSSDMIRTQSFEKLLIMIVITIIIRVRQLNYPLDYQGAVFCWLQTSCATSQTVHDWQSSLSGCRCTTLEQLAWYHAGWFTVEFSVPTEALSVPAVLPRCCTITVAQLCYCNTLSSHSSGNGYLLTESLID